MVGLDQTQIYIWLSIHLILKGGCEIVSKILPDFKKNGPKYYSITNNSMIVIKDKNSHGISKSLSIVIFLLFLTVIPYSIIKTGPVIQQMCGQDICMYLDGGWRVLQGHIPHIDFTSVLGVLFFLLVAASMKLTGATIWSLIWLNLFMFVVLSTWAFVLSSNRMSPINTLLSSFAAGLSVCGTYTTGFPLEMTSYAMNYNRYCYAMIFIVIIEQFFLSETENKYTDIFGGLSTGIMSAAMFLIKPSYFVAAILIIIVRYFLFGQSLKWFISFMAGLAAALLPVVVYMKFNMIPLIEDYLRAGKLRTHWMTHRLIMEKLKFQIFNFLSLLACWLLLPKELGHYKGREISSGRIGLVLLFLTILGFGFQLTNYGFVDLPLFAIISIIPLEYFRRSRFFKKHGNSWSPKLYSSLILLFLIVSGSFYSKNFYSLVFAEQAVQNDLPSVKKFNAENIKEFYVIRADGPHSNYYVEMINDGLDILRRHTTHNDKIICSIMGNIFSFALQRESPRGDTVFVGYNGTFNEKIFWEPERFFRECDVFMVPTESDCEAAGPFVKVYFDYLKKHFRLKANSRYWWLFVKREKPNSHNGNDNPQ